MEKLKIIVAGIVCFISVIIMGVTVYFIFFGKNEMLYLATLINVPSEILNMSMILFFLGSGGSVLFTLDYLVNA